MRRTADFAQDVAKFTHHATVRVVDADQLHGLAVHDSSVVPRVRSRFRVGQ